MSLIRVAGADVVAVGGLVELVGPALWSLPPQLAQTMTSTETRAVCLSCMSIGWRSGDRCLQLESCPQATPGATTANSGGYGPVAPFRLEIWRGVGALVPLRTAPEVIQVTATQ